MNEQDIKAEQLGFYQSGRSGCVFAAIAANDLQKYEWNQEVFESVEPDEIDRAINFYKDKKGISTLSLIFPNVKTVYDLCTLINTLGKCKNIIIESNDHEGYNCFGIRVKYGEMLSWVTGFGPFCFFPATRQAPYTEISFRIKPKPHYDYELKEAPSDILHLAHMDVKNVGAKSFKKMWDTSLKKTEKILGHKPDFISAAKTTFSIPAVFKGHKHAA
ncbi:hypothetical protein HWV01_19785 [Moritella sp. 5]|uniref:hypothetical protein n=1 Tax=Moritella sp. 5 TaxID=2746231 RepID=UPI001BABAE16|nr:hypothetical protein [Moritella sp. 5]QUM82360.1 hypothetical protein HWV01_19785 [Moritella sp. 5]